MYESGDQECGQEARVARWECVAREGEDGVGDEGCVAGYPWAEALVPGGSGVLSQRAVVGLVLRMDRRRGEWRVRGAGYVPPEPPDSVGVFD